MSSLWPLTDLGQNYKMPDMKNYFLYREGAELLLSPCPGCGKQSLGHRHTPRGGGHQTGKEAQRRPLFSPHLIWAYSTVTAPLIGKERVFLKTG